MLSRRDFLKGVSLIPLAGLLPRSTWEAAAAAATETFAFFNPHQANVVREATARIIPGPLDDILEMGHPGAREANVVRYVDVLLTALDHHPEHIYGGGPFGATASQWVGLSAAQHLGWQERIAKLKAAYVAGIVLLDAKAGGDFTAAPPSKQDQILVDADVASFQDILYTHAIEGTYSDPLYGGNTNRVSWNEIKFPGPSMPRGYTRAEVGESDGLDVIDPTGVVAELLALLSTNPAVQAAVARNSGR